MSDFKMLVTGGAGFIGINFVKYLQKYTNQKFVVLDKMGYASNKSELDRMEVEYEVIDLADANKLGEFFRRHKIDVIFHFAAESHVDNSIKDSKPFVQSNVVGTVNLLDQAVKHQIRRFIHMSTDEVFGEIEYPNKFDENSKIQPKNPYSASKAAAEHFVISYGNTHKLPYTIINCSNNYGPFQNVEKLIPKTITNLKLRKPVPVYGNGQQIRDWIYVYDTCVALYQIYKKGKSFDRYCLGGDMEMSNIELIQTLIHLTGAKEDLIQYVADRPGHDTRYSTNIEKVKVELKWMPKVPLISGLKETVDWISEQT